MIADFRSGDCPCDVKTDLCVIGTGAAGITIAAALAGSNVSVCMVESGGHERDHETQALCAGDVVGLSRGSDPASTRFRMFGGTTCEWGGGCIPLDASDMEVRDWIPHSGWPIVRDDLDPFYNRARDILSLPDYPFFDERLALWLSRAPLEFDSALLTHAYSLGSKRPQLGDVHWPRLKQSKNVIVLLHANVLELNVNASGTVVERASLQSLQGRVGSVQAQYFVIACGGIENARLLLLSNSVNKQGLGNDYDLVGRFFMDHPKGKLGCIVAHQPEKLTAAYDPRLAERRLRIYPQIALSTTLQKEQRVLNGRVRPTVIEENVPDGIVALRSLRCDLANGTKSDLPRDIRRVIANFGDIIPGVRRRVLHGLPAVSTIRIDLNGFFEQAPNPDSRVSLGDDVDALGQRRVRLDWRLTELDRRTYETALKVFSAEVDRLELGHVIADPWMEPAGAAFDGVEGAAHHLGTTRMSSEPRTGVVDRNCRVHDVDNLYVAGSSVFPTGGWAFPTYTIVALALRLSDMLRQRLIGLPA
jgi:choline dehydrogenase-like flavoprotein